MPRLAVLSVLSAASSPCPDLNLIHYILLLGDFSKQGEASLSFKDLSTWTDQFDFVYMKEIPDAQLSALKVLIQCLKIFFN